MMQFDQSSDASQATTSSSAQNTAKTQFSMGEGFSYELNQQIYTSRSYAAGFSVPAGISSTKGFTMKSWLGYAGTPSSPLTEALQSNASGAYKTIETETVPYGSITSGGWTSTAFSSSLAPALGYRVVYTSSTSSSNYYTVASANSGAVPIIWVQTLSGQNATLDPYITMGTNWNAVPAEPFYFEVPDTMKINTIQFQDSDRAYDPNNITIYLETASTGSVLATATMSLAQWRGGSDALIPYEFNTAVTLTPGVKYELTFSALPSTDAYDGSDGVGVTQDFIADNINPPYLGQSKVPTFRLMYASITPLLSSSNPNMGPTDLQDSPGENGNTEVALRFYPTSNESIQAVELNVISADSSSAILDVELRPDTTTPVGSHPSSEILAEGSIALSAINSTFKASTLTTTGYSTWANVTMNAVSGGSVALTKGTPYWIVLATSPSSAYVGLLRLVNPNRYLVYVSTSNFATSWNPPSDGPSEFAFVIQTSVETFNNGVDGSYEYEFNTGAFAQSFEVSINTQLASVAAAVESGNGGWNMTLSIETDGGSDSPSGKLVAYGATGFSSSSNDYGASDGYGYGIGLEMPVNLTANTKYWMVWNATCTVVGTCSYPSKADPLIYRSDVTAPLNYGGNTLHYEVQKGATWENQPFGFGDVVFILYGTAPFTTIIASSTTTTASPTSSATSPSTALSCSPSPVAVGSPVKCTATVTGSSPTGKITWSSSGSGRFSAQTCKLYKGACSVKYTPTSASSPVGITAIYAGDKRNPPSGRTVSLTVALKTSKTAVSCKPASAVAGTAVVTCTAKVIGYSPTNNVSWSSTGTGAVSLPTGTTCTLTKGSCSVTFTGVSSGTVTIRATYGGDSNNTVSFGAVKLTIRPAKTKLSVSCAQSSVSVGFNTTCTATVVGNAGSVAGETVVWSQSKGPGVVSFSSSATCTLSAEGTCSITLTAAGEGSATIRAAYGGDHNNLRSSKTYELTIEP